MDVVKLLVYLCYEYKEVVGGIFAACLLFFWLRRCVKRRQPISTTPTENGELVISRSAIFSLIQSACETIPDGYVKRVRLNNKRRMLVIQLQVILRAGNSFETSSIRFQEAVKSAVSRCFGSLKDIRINVTLVGIEHAPVDTGSADSLQP